jgi:hypothetical protein
MRRRQPGVITAIALINLQVWFNGVARALGSRRAARAVVIVTGALLVGWVVLGTGSLADQLRIDMSVVADLAGPVAGILFTLPAVTTLLLAMYAPDRSVLTDALAVLPIRPGQRVAALRWLNVGIGAVLGGACAAPLALQFLGVLPVATAAVVLAEAVLVVAGGAFCGQTAFAAVTLAWTWLTGVGGVGARAVGGATAALGLAWMFVLSLPTGGRTAGTGPLLVLAEPLLAAVTARADAAVLLALLAGGTAAAGVVAAGVDRLPQRSRPTRRPRRVLLPPARTLVGLEVRQWLRFPLNATFLLFSVFVLIGGLAVWAGGRDGGQWDDVVYLFLALVSTVGIGSFGPTRPAHWIHAVAGRPHAWVLPKLASVLVVWAALVVGFGAAFAWLTPWSVLDGPALLPALLLELVAGCLVGLVLPVSREQSLGAALAESAGIVVVLGVTLGVQSLPWITSSAGYLLTHAALIALLVAGYVAVARRSGRAPLGVAA